MRKQSIDKAIAKLPSLNEYTTPNNKQSTNKSLTNKQSTKMKEQVKTTSQTKEVNKVNDTTNSATTYKKVKESKYQTQEVDTKGLKSLSIDEVNQLSHVQAVDYLKVLATLNPKSLWTLYPDIEKFEEKIEISLSKKTGQADALLNPKKVLTEVINFLKVPRRKPALLSILMRALLDDLTQIVE